MTEEFTDYTKLHWVAYDYQIIRDRAAEVMAKELAMFKEDPNNGVPRFTHVNDMITCLLTEEIYPMVKHFREVVKTHIVWVNRDKDYQVIDRHKTFLITLIEEHKGNCKVLKDRTGILLRDGKAVGWPLVEKAMKEIVTEFPIVIHPDQFYNQFA